MTEAEWEKTATVRNVLAFVEGRASERKLRLFVCACCRIAWEFFRDVALRQAVELAEAYANGSVTSEELARAHEKAGRLQEQAEETGRIEAVTNYAAWVATSRPLFVASAGVASAVIGLAGLVSNRDPLLAGRCMTTFAWVWPTMERERALLRDNVGNPFKVGGLA